MANPPSQANLWLHLPDSDWALYRRVLEPALARNMRFVLGGGFAFSYYTGRWRDTKDIDLYILPRDSPAFIQLLEEVGFPDYFARQPYDRGWIHRGYRGGVIVDLIWASANRRGETTESWLERGTPVTIRGLDLKIMPVEELFFTKLYVLQRERCDWPDLLNVLRSQIGSVDWQHLLARLQADVPLLGGLLCVFGWLCPEQARRLPPWLWERVGAAPPPPGGPPCVNLEGRVRLLDSRDWFGPSPP